MALRAELIGPYCLFLVVSSVCADSATSWRFRPTASPLTARMTLLDSTAAALKLWGCNSLPSWLKGYRSTINSRIRTGTDSGNPTV